MLSCLFRSFQAPARRLDGRCARRPVERDLLESSAPQLRQHRKMIRKEAGNLLGAPLFPTGRAEHPVNARFQPGERGFLSFGANPMGWQNFNVFRDPLDLLLGVSQYPERSP